MAIFSTVLTSMVGSKETMEETNKIYKAVTTRGLASTTTAMNLMGISVM